MKAAVREREETTHELAQVKRRLEQAQGRVQAIDCLVELVSIMLPELRLSRPELEDQLKNMKDGDQILLFSRIDRYCELIQRSLGVVPELVERAEELRMAREFARTFERTFVHPNQMQVAKERESVLFPCQHRVGTNQVVELVRFCAENGQAVRCPIVGCGALVDYSNCSEEDQHKLAQVHKSAAGVTGRLLWQSLC